MTIKPMVETIDHKSYLIWWDTEKREVVQRIPQPTVSAAFKAMSNAVKEQAREEKKEAD